MTGRIVDVKGALEELPYPKDVSGNLVFSVTDPLAEWNTGTWRLSVWHGEGSVEKMPPETAAAVTLSVRWRSSPLVRWLYRTWYSRKN